MGKNWVVRNEIASQGPDEDVELVQLVFISAPTLKGVIHALRKKNPEELRIIHNSFGGPFGNVLASWLKSPDFPKSVRTLTLCHSDECSSYALPIRYPFGEYATAELLDAFSKLPPGIHTVNVRSWRDCHLLLHSLRGVRHLKHLMLKNTVILLQEGIDDLAEIISNGLRSLEFHDPSLPCERSLAFNWFGVASAISESTTLTELTLRGYLSDSLLVPISKLPSKLRVFHVEDGWNVTRVTGGIGCPKALSSNEYPFPSTLTKIHIRGGWLAMDGAEDTILPKLRMVPAVVIYGRDYYPCSILPKLVSRPNEILQLRIDDHRIDPTEFLMELVLSPHCNLLGFDYMNEYPRGIFPGTPDLMRTIRGRTRIRDFCYAGVERFTKALISPWFHVSQAILSSRYVPRFAGREDPSVDVAWEDYLGKIAETLGWNLDALRI